MKKIIINSIFFAVFCILNIPFAKATDIKVRPYLSLYDAPKYPAGFKNFSYTNPAAPKGGRIVLPSYGGFDNFNPYIFKGVAASEVALLMTDSLGVAAADDNATVYPLIAEKFELPDDKSFVGFILNPKARFHDGSPITADDVIFSFKALTTLGAPLYKVYYADVEKVEKINDRHVRFYFKKSTQNRELPLILAQLPIFSAAYYAHRDFSKPVLEPTLGNGPYRISDFSVGKYIVLQRVKDYWAQNLPSRRGYFNFDEVRFDYYQDTTVTLQALFANNIDLREEYISKIWVTGYNNDLIKSKKIKKEEIHHNRTAILQNFAFNTRRPQFTDKRVRQAIGLAFDFDWANQKLFYNQYLRLESYFSNSEMEATGKPQGRELQILKKFASQLDKEVFAEVPVSPKHKDYLQSRQNLRQAVALLKQAGYDFVDGKMTNLKTGQPLEFEVLSSTANGSSFTRVMLPFIKNLEKIGIKAVFRTLETNIMKNRMDNFDFDMLIASYAISSMPGNEQKEMWGSQSADIKGSYNLIGIKNPVVDKLIDGLIKAVSKEDYISHVKALDRVLRHEYYMIPQWYTPYQRVAYWDKFEHPKTDLLIGLQYMTWWMKTPEQSKVRQEAR